MFYYVEGKGILVVLLYGFCEDYKIWEEFQNDLCEEFYQVIVIDLFGFGVFDVVEGIIIEGMARWVYVLLQELGVGLVVFIGYFMGGYVGLVFVWLFLEVLLGLGFFYLYFYVDEEEKKVIWQKSVEFIQWQGYIFFVKQLIFGFFVDNFVCSNIFLLEKFIYWVAKFFSEGIIVVQQVMINWQDEIEILC